MWLCTCSVLRERQKGNSHSRRLQLAILGAKMCHKDPEKIQVIFSAAKVMMWVEAWNPQCFWSSCRSLSIFESTMSTQSHQLYLASCVFSCVFEAYMLYAKLLAQRATTSDPGDLPELLGFRSESNLAEFTKCFFCTQSSACHLILRQSA